MKLIIIFASLFPFTLFAQYDNALPAPVPANSNLLMVGFNTVLIHPLDEMNGAQKWITFDSALAIISTKKLVTPHAANIVDQRYLAGKNAVIRIDQFFVNGVFQISAFVFDVDGNLKNSKPIDIAKLTGNGSTRGTFEIAQSADKSYVSLVQTYIADETNLSVSGIVLDDQLNVVNAVASSIPYDQKLFNRYVPMVDNNKNILLVIADKFDSYKLSGSLVCYAFSSSGKIPQEIKMEFDRKKIKGLRFFVPENTLHISALFSEKTNKDDVAGVLHTGYDFSKKQKLPIEEFVYSNDIIQQLKKTYAPEGRKGSLLNYISLLPPAATSTGFKYEYAVLMPAPHFQSPAPKTISQPVDELRQVKLEQDRVAALVGTRPAGSSAPLNVAEATVAAATNYNPSYVEPNPYAGWKPKQAPPRQNTGAEIKNLLYISAKDSRHKFLKFKIVNDPHHKFFTYMPVEDGYSALHYVMPNFKKSYLKHTSVNAAGKVSEKIVFEDKNKVLPQHYPHIATTGNFIAFYEDVKTGEMGLVKLQL